MIDPRRAFAWTRYVEALLLLSAGVCIGARMAGAELWIGLLGVVLIVAWVFVIGGEPGPNDP